MAVIKGKDARVLIKVGGTLTEVSYLSTVNITGYKLNTVELNIVGQDFAVFKPTYIDGGTINITGYYDPDSSAQSEMVSAGLAGTELLAGDVKIELDDSTYAQPLSGGTDCFWIVTDFQQVNADPKDIDKTSFAFKCSGQTEIIHT